VITHSAGGDVGCYLNNFARSFVTGNDRRHLRQVAVHGGDVRGTNPGRVHAKPNFPWSQVADRHVVKYLDGCVPDGGADGGAHSAQCEFVG
jgi:hypothetical protein